MYLKALAISAPCVATSSMPAQHLLVNGCLNTGVSVVDVLYACTIFNRPGVAGAVLQTL